jgi:hypothetical protein
LQYCPFSIQVIILNRLTNWQTLINEYYVTITGDGNVRTNVLDFSHWINNFRDYSLPVGSKDEYLQLTFSPGLYNNGIVIDIQGKI